jgi:tetratricopeptide (TPR) repeat protein
MKIFAAIAISILCSAATLLAIGAGWVAPKVQAAPAAPQLDALVGERIAALERHEQELDKKLDDLAMSIEARASSDSRASVGSVDDAVARWFAEHAASVAEKSSAATNAETSATASAVFDVRAAVASLRDENLSNEERQELWKKIREAGELDAVVAEYEKRAQENPSDPKAQVELGEAYLQKIFAAGSNGPEAGKWAIKADKSFDVALELDPHHWEARFDKAVSLSFWPPIFGKQNEAIHHFEILVEQQAGLPKEAHFAQTHLLLGNLYQQSGNLDKAKAAWAAGLALFPDDAELKHKLELAGG